MLLLTIIYGSLTPDPVEVQIEQGDKLLHVAAYLVLMSWFANLYEAQRERVMCIAGCVALGVGLEFAQRLTAVRTFDVADMVANTAGVAMGLILAPPRLPNYLRLAERLITAQRRG